MKELLALLPETRRKLLLFLCEHRDEFRLQSDDFRLRTIFGISEETGMAFITVRKASNSCMNAPTFAASLISLSSCLNAARCN